MPLVGNWLGMDLVVEDTDRENHTFFEWCGKHELRLQRWQSNGLLSYPPGTACPWDGTAECEWERVEGKGTVMSYSEVHHPLLPAFRDQVPYLILLVELDEQRGQPSEHEALRILANLVTAEGELAPPEMVQRVGIGTRVRMVFAEVGEGFALPQWTLDENVDQPTPWRYPQE
ncbi:MAG: hypothetical protein GY910_09250 [bacterium]|nr:hypothetical protein [Deltaproteobacteria bacterium]MCP4905156.1 hypothetical protein [bacterium]